MSDWEDKGLSALYRRTPRSEPAAVSDRRVLESARRVLGQRRGRTRQAAWALAASVVLGVGIGWHLMAPVDVLDVLGPPPPVPDGVTESGAVPAKGRDTEAGSERQPRFSGQERAAAPAAAPKQTAPVAASEPIRVEDVPMPGLACRDQWPAPDATADAWLAAVARAEAEGEAERARCLRARYRQLFDESGH